MENNQSLNKLKSLITGFSILLALFVIVFFFNLIIGVFKPLYLVTGIIVLLIDATFITIYVLKLKKLANKEDGK